MGLCVPEGRVTLVSMQGRVLEGRPDGRIASGWTYGQPNDNCWWEYVENLDGSHSFINQFGNRLSYANHTEFWVEIQGNGLVALRTWTGHYVTDNPMMNLDDCWPFMIGQWECKLASQFVNLRRL